MNIIYSQEQNSKKQKKDTIKSSRVHCNIKKKLKNKKYEWKLSKVWNGMIIGLLIPFYKERNKRKKDKVENNKKKGEKRGKKKTIEQHEWNGMIVSRS